MNNQNKKLFIAVLCFFVGFVFEAQTKANNVVELESICRKEDSFSYKGYKVEKHFDSEKEISTITVKKGKRVVATKTLKNDPVMKFFYGRKLMSGHFCFCR